MVELSFGKIFSSAIAEYNLHLIGILKILVILYLLPQIVLTVCLHVFSAYLQTLNLDSVGANMSQILAMGFGALMFFVIIIIVNSLLYSLMYIAIIRIVSYRRTKEEVTVWKILGDAKKYLFSYMGLSILMGFALLFLCFALIVPAIIFAIYWFFAPFILILENKGIAESMSLSKKLVTGRWWTVFGYTFLMGLAVVGVSFAVSLLMIIPTIGLVLIPIVGPIISQVLTDSIMMFVIPFGIIFGEQFYRALSGSEQPHKKEEIAHEK